MSLRGSSLVSGSSVYLLANVLNAAVPFALVPVFTRYLTPAEYGEVAMFQTFLGGLAAFVGLNAVGAAARKYYDSAGGDQLAKFVGACIQILTVSTVAILLIVALLQEPLSRFLSLSREWLLLAVVVSSASTMIQLRLGQWQVRGEVIPYGAFQVALALANVVLALVFVVVLLRGAAGRMEALLWSTIAGSVIALFLLKRSSLLRIRSVHRDHIAEALRFGVPLIPHVAGGFLLLSADRLVIANELGLAQAGIYMLAVQFAQMANLCFDSVNKAYVPWLFERLRRDDAQEKRRIVRYTYAWFAFLLAGAALVFLVAPPIVRLVAGPAYSEAGELVGWLILGQVFGGMYMMVTNYIFYSKRTGLLSAVTIGTGALNIALVVAFTAEAGAKGAAWAFCVSMAIRFLLTWWVAQKRHPMPWLARSASTA